MILVLSFYMILVGYADLWSAPAERSGDGALVVDALYPKRCRATPCHRTPKVNGLLSQVELSGDIRQTMEKVSKEGLVRGIRQWDIIGCNQQRHRRRHLVLPAKAFGLIGPYS